MARKFFWLLQMSINLVAKEFQKRECCHKNHAKVPSKADYSMSNISMEDFTPSLNSAIDTIELGDFLVRRYVRVYYLLQAYGYDWKERSYQRFLKPKLTKKITIYCYLCQGDKTDRL